MSTSTSMNKKDFIVNRSNTGNSGNTSSKNHETGGILNNFNEIE